MKHGATLLSTLLMMLSSNIARCEDPMKDFEGAINRQLHQIEIILNTFYTEEFSNNALELFSQIEPIILQTPTPRKPQQSNYYSIIVEDLNGKRRITEDRNGNRRTSVQDSGPSTPQNEPQSFMNDETQHSPMFPFLGQREEESHFKPYDPRKQTEKITFEDVIGQQEAIDKAKIIVEYLKHPETFKKVGARAPRGAVFYGHPGTGKTMLAKAMAHEAGCKFFAASGSEFVNTFVGKGAANVRELFAEAKKHAPAIIFIDEADALASERGKGHNEESDRTLTEMLVQMDGFNKYNNIFVIVATNRLELLDKAFLRRLNDKVEFKLPDIEGRKKLLAKYVKECTLDPTITPKELTTIIEQLASVTTGFSHDDTQKLINHAAIQAAIGKKEFVTAKNLHDACDAKILGDRNHHKITALQKERTAYHEAGHTVAALMLGEPIYKTSIISRGNAAGVMIGKEKHEYITDYTKQELINQMITTFAGYAVDKMHNSIRPGACEDLKRARELARFMVRECGMGTKTAGRAYPKEGKVSLEEQKSYDTDEKELMQVALQQAEQILTLNKPILDKIAKKLIEKEILNEDEIYTLANMKKPAAA